MTMPRRTQAGEVRPSRIRASTLPGATLETLITAALDHAEVPLSAYDIADDLRAHDHHVVIPSIYRALDRLCVGGVVERVEMLSAWRRTDGTRTVRLICLSCGRTTGLPIPDLYDALEASVRAAGFGPQKTVLEISGICADCAAPDRS